MISGDSKSGWGKLKVSNLWPNAFVKYKRKPEAWNKHVVLDLPGGSDGKASVYNAGDLGSTPGSGRSLEKEMAIHSSTLAWKIPWTEEPGRLQSMGRKESDTTERLHFHFPYYESEATSSSTDTAHPFRLIPWLPELDSGMNLLTK